MDAARFSCYGFSKQIGYDTKDEWHSPVMRVRNSAAHSLTCGIGAPPLNLPIISPNPYILNRFTSNIPMPTLYAGDAVRKPKLSVIEVLLYNMAALLAGVAAGYDLRISNVSPVHPTLLSEVPALKAPLDMEYPHILDLDRRFAINTYHGTGKHNRAPLSATTYAANSDEHDMHYRIRSNSPLQSVVQRETPSTLLPYYAKIPTAGNTPKHQFQSHYQQLPQQLPLTLSSTSGLGSNFTTNTSAMLSSSLGSGISHTQPPTPSPRRKISTSSFTEVLEYSTHEDEAPLQEFDGFRLETGFEPTPVRKPNDYLRNGPSFSNDGGVYGAGAHRSGYFGSNYFPYRPEMSLAYERDCKSYPDYSYEYNHRLPNYYDYNFDQHNYQQPQIRTPPPRVPQMGVTASGHRRTPSSISNSSNINSGFNFEHEDKQKRLELYDYDGMNLNHKGNNIAANYVEKSSTPPPVVVPTPTKQELYKSSPKLINRLNRKGNGLGDELTGNTSLGPTSYSNRIFDYEQQYNAAYIAMNKIKSTTPKHQPMEQRHVYSTPMSPVNMKAHINAKQQERPASLPFKHMNSVNTDCNSTTTTATKLRSSMKRYNFKTPNGASNGAVAINNLTSKQGTPTNPTPDSATSDDSSYLSAKEGSISSQHSRVRFSPDAGYLDATTTVGSDTIAGNLSMHLPIVQNQDYANHSSMSLLNRRISRRHTNDMSTGSTSTSPTSSS